MKSDDLCFGRPIAKRFASLVPDLLSYWNHNKRNLDESQLKGAFVNVPLTTTAVTVKKKDQGGMAFHKSEDFLSL